MTYITDNWSHLQPSNRKEECNYHKQSIDYATRTVNEQIQEINRIKKNAKKEIKPVLHHIFFDKIQDSYNNYKKIREIKKQTRQILEHPNFLYKSYQRDLERAKHNYYEYLNTCRAFDHIVLNK